MPSANTLVKRTTGDAMLVHQTSQCRRGRLGFAKPIEEIGPLLVRWPPDLPPTTATGSGMRGERYIRQIDARASFCRG
jgi:hypothetical protein